MTKYYRSLSNKLATINGKLTDVIVWMEECIAKLQKNIDSDMIDDINSNNDDQNIEAVRQNNENFTLPLATSDKFIEFEQKLITDHSYRRKIVSTYFFLNKYNY